MSGLRNYHTKSRNGCTNCKKRRVKCNLQPPKCGNCSRRNEPCSFQRSLFLSTSKDKGDEEETEEHLGFNAYLSEKGSRPLSKQQPSFFPDDTILEKELRWHFTTSCASSLALVPGAQFIWESEIPVHGHENPFLSQALTALSALHMCYLQPPDTLQYAIAAGQHFRNATTQFRSTVKHITRDNCVALFGFSLIVAMFELGVCTNVTARPLIQDKKHVAGFDALFALRVTWNLTPSLGPWLLQTRLGGLLSSGRDFDQQGVLDGDIELAIAQLDMLNLSAVQSDSSRETCAQALDALRYWYAFMGRRLTIWLHVVWWPAAVTDEFLQLLRNRNPTALAIYCLWIVGMKRVPMRWFMEGWAAGTLASVLDSLDAEWRGQVEWALTPVLPQRLADLEYQSS